MGEGEGVLGCGAPKMRTFCTGHISSTLPLCAKGGELSASGAGREALLLSHVSESRPGAPILLIQIEMWANRRLLSASEPTHLRRLAAFAALRGLAEPVGPSWLLSGN
jgi:hypothetical protein